MKINEVFDQDTINELGTTPMGIGSKMWAGVKSKVPGSIGRSGAAALDVGKRSNELNKKFQNWALRTGVDMTNVAAADVDSFLASEGLPKFNHAGITSYNLKDPGENKELWTKVSQQSFRASGVGGGQQLGQQFRVNQNSEIKNIMSQLTDPTKLAAVKAALGMP